jgi:hypothetical protein
MKVVAGVVLSVLTSVAAGDSPTFYRCDNHGTTVYSDRPCAADARPHQLDGSRVTVYEAPPKAERAASSRTDKRTGRQSRANRDSAATYEKHQVKCDRLGRSLRDVRSKMRTGYGVDEGERLKERHRQLTAQRRAEKCR